MGRWELGGLGLAGRMKRRRSLEEAKQAKPNIYCPKKAKAGDAVAAPASTQPAAAQVLSSAQRCGIHHRSAPNGRGTPNGHMDFHSKYKIMLCVSEDM